MLLWRMILFLLAALSARAAEETFYLGTFTHAPGGSQGIYVGTLDADTGRLGPLRLAAKETDPNFLALSPDHRYVFAALNEAVESFTVQPDGTLRALNQQPSGGGDTCHVSLDQTGREVFVASYGAGCISGFPVGADGRIGPRVAFAQFSGSGPNRLRQQSPHAHATYADPENRFVYGCDLGTDNIWIYRLGPKGELVPADPPVARLPPGSGPRHLAFDGRFVYVVSEMGVTTSVFRRDAGTGALKLLETVGNIAAGPKPGTGSAEVSVHPSGKWLYVSSRVDDVMSVFAINRAFDPARPAKAGHDGPPPRRLTLAQNIDSPVMFPRSFGIDPTGRWMIVAGQNDNRISVMKIAADSGRLTPTREEASVGSPVCVLFVPEEASAHLQSLRREGHP
ncbi:MAG: lactonase family protein [Verrucomicrobiota bacterium]